MKEAGEAGPIETRCPSCGATVVYRGLDNNAFFPFCSKRCQLVDLDKWFEEEHRIQSELKDAGGRDGGGNGTTS